MSLKPQNSYVVPEDTAKVAQAIFPDGSVYLRIYNTFGTLFQDNDFAALSPQDGQPAESPLSMCQSPDRFLLLDAIFWHRGAVVLKAWKASLVEKCLPILLISSENQYFSRNFRENRFYFTKHTFFTLIFVVVLVACQQQSTPTPTALPLNHLLPTKPY